MPVPSRTSDNAQQAVQLTLDQALDLFERSRPGAQRVRLKLQIGRTVGGPHHQELSAKLYQRGLAALRRGEAALAISFLGWLVEREPESFDAIVAKASAIEALSGRDAAAEAFEAFIAEKPAPLIRRSEQESARKVGIVVSGGGTSLSFANGGFTLPAGHAQAQHLATCRAWNTHFIFADEADRHEFEEFDVLVNAISDADAFPQALQKLAELDALPVINRPASCLANTRENLSEKLSGRTDFVVPKTIRVPKGTDILKEMRRQDLSFPFLLRPVGSQTGAGLVLVESEADLPQSANESQDIYLTEFSDFRSADGLYRKYRCWQIGSRVHPSHMFFHSNWNVHGHCRWETMLHNPWMQADEQRFLAGDWGAREGAIREAMAALAGALELDYFGVDFGFLPDGRLVVFEANATMRSHYPEYGNGFRYIGDTTARHIALFQELIASRLGGTT